MKISRLALILGFAVLGASSLAGCKTQRRRVIGVVPKSTAHLFWVSVRAGVMQAAKEHNVDIEWNGPPTETDFSRQIQIVDSMVARKLDALAIAAGDRKALVQSVDRAMAAGIPVAIFDSGLDSDNITTFVATDNYQAGRLAARTLAGLIGSKGTVGMIMNLPGSTSTMDRESGFQEAIAQEFPEIKIVAQQFGMADRAKARAATENVLTAHPNIAGIFASSEPSSVGAALAIRGREMSGKVKYVAFDSSDDLLRDLRDGVTHALVVQDPFRMGYDTIKHLVARLDGKSPPKRVDLYARVISLANLATPEVQKLLTVPGEGDRPGL